MSHDDRPMHDELQERIDASLRRLFTPPAGLQGPGGIAARAVADARRRHAAASHDTPAGGSGLLGGLAAAAALLAGVGLWAGGGDSPASTDPAAGDGLEVALGNGDAGSGSADSMRPAADRERTVGPAGGAAGPHALAAASPDLDALYDRFTQGTDGIDAALPDEVMMCSLEPRFELEQVSLEERLTQNYDACLDVDTPEACALLGPYAVPEWPSATVVVAWCATEAAPTMLVVDDQTGYGCGWAPREGKRPAFHKSVGSLAVWEVGGGEPHLLDGIRPCPSGR